ncbi:MAG: helix-turn-helix domain-containing protein [Ruminococcus sp.]|nr:helix-turn-helix domain-containing protein [Ruminococcus sp.]
MIYSEKLKNLREENGLKQNELANILSIERNTYSQYESEYSIIPIKHLVNICDYFNVSIDYILGFTSTHRYNKNINGVNKSLAGKCLKEFRKENNLTQKKLAETLNTVQQVIANYENGTNLIALPFLYTICSKYKISADYLLGKIDNPKYLK